MRGHLKTHEWANAIIESAHHLMIATDPDGVVTWFNKASERNLGYLASEVVGKHTPALWHDLGEVVRRAQELSEELERPVEPGFEVFVLKPRLFRSETGSWTFVRKDGSRFPAQLTVTCVRSEANEIVGYLGVIQDVSEREQLISELQQANAELEEFAYRTSHDLRSPLVSSLALVRMARTGVGEGDVETISECLQHIETSLSKLDNLVGDILTLTEAKQEEEAQEVDVRELVESSLASLSHLADFARLDVQTDLAHTGPTVFPPTRLRLIVENLLSNAVKYQDTAAESSWIRIDTRNTDGGFEISVADNGLGIPKDQQHKLFRMFKRFHNRVSFGSGLGLYMVKKSAGILGGEVFYEDLRPGTRFRVLLPAHYPAENAQAGRA